MRLITQKQLGPYMDGDEFAHRSGNLILACLVLAHDKREPILVSMHGCLRLSHRAFSRCLEEGCFPNWLRLRIFIENAFDGPLCEQLSFMAYKMAMSGRLRSVLSSFEQVTLSVADAVDIVAEEKIRMARATEWGRKFLTYQQEAEEALRSMPAA